MKLLVLYRPFSEHASVVETFIRDFQRQHDMEGKIEMVSLDTAAGAQKAEAYGLWAYPAIIASTDDGRALNVWQGEPLPLMNEVAGYIFS